MTTEQTQKALNVVSRHSDTFPEADSTFEGLGIDSLDAAKLCMDIEHNFDFTFTNEEYESINSIPTLLKILNTKLNTQ